MVKQLDFGKFSKLSNDRFGFRIKTLTLALPYKYLLLM